MLQITSNKCEPDQISEKNTSLQLSNKLTNKRQVNTTHVLRDKDKNKILATIKKNVLTNNIFQNTPNLPSLYLDFIVLE